MLYLADKNKGIVALRNKDGTAWAMLFPDRQTYDAWVAEGRRRAPPDIQAMVLDVSHAEELSDAAARTIKRQKIVTVVVHIENGEARMMPVELTNEADA